MSKKKPTIALADQPAPAAVSGSSVTRAQGTVDVGSVRVNIPGFPGLAAPSIENYRRMRRNPTVAIARVAAAAPIKTSQWSYKSKDEAPEEMLATVQDAIEPLRKQFIRDAVFALDYGYAAFEVIWKAKNGLIVPRRLKPLLPEKTEPIIDQSTGDYLGLKNFDVSVGQMNSVWLTHDSECDSLFGRSRHENIRKEHNAWESTLERLGKYTNRVACPIPMLMYPEGRSRDKSGNEVDNFEIAQRVLATIGAGNGVTMPNTLAKNAEEAINRGVDIDKLRSWIFSFLEVNGAHGADLVAVMRYFDSLLIRGWLTPERAITEGQFGTKAEAETHWNVALLASMDALEELLSQVNRFLVNKILDVNYGPEAKGLVWIEPEPLNQTLKALLSEIIKNVLTQPANVDMLLEMLSMDAMLDQIGLPKRADNVDAIQQTAIDDRLVVTPPLALPAFSSPLTAAMLSFYSELEKS